MTNLISHMKKFHVLNVSMKLIALGWVEGRSAGRRRGCKKSEERRVCSEASEWKEKCSFKGRGWVEG